MTDQQTTPEHQPEAPPEQTQPQPQQEQAAPSLRQRFADWPQKGGEGDAQPWDLDKLGVSKSDRDLEPGAPDTVSPVVIRHSRPTLTSGSAHPIVADLGRRLSELGYANSVSEGTNALGVVDESIMNAVERFREDYGVEEDPTPFGGTTTAAVLRAAQIIGPYTWEAIVRASDRDEEQAA